MSRKSIILALIMTSFVLVGCSSGEDLASDSTEMVEEMTPLEEARKELFEEIGVAEDEEISEVSEDEIPVVLPTPPELPKTDVDLGELTTE